MMTRTRPKIIILSDRERAEANMAIGTDAEGEAVILHAPEPDPGGEHRFVRRLKRLRPKAPRYICLYCGALGR